MNNRLTIVTIFLVTSFSFLIFTCAQKQEVSDNVSFSMSRVGVLDEQESALILMASLCFTCHNPDHDVKPRLGPPMDMVRSHYYRKDITQEDFVNKIAAFVAEPSIEKTIMHGAVRNFGLMPKSFFQEEEVKKVAAYLYDNDLSSEEWKAKWKSFKERS
jgi:cytochrome c551/c552